MGGDSASGKPWGGVLARMASRQLLRFPVRVRILVVLLLSTVLVLEVDGQQKSDHYKTLGVQKNANDREIKKAYHKVLQRVFAADHLAVPLRLMWRLIFPSMAVIWFIQVCYVVRSQAAVVQLLCQRGRVPSRSGEERQAQTNHVISQKMTGGMLFQISARSEAPSGQESRL